MTTLPEGGVVITLADVYRTVLTLTGRVDAALSRAEQTDRAIAEHAAELRPLTGAAERLTDHELRLRALERSRWPIQSLTILVALTAVVIAAIALLTRQ